MNDTPSPTGSYENQSPENSLAASPEPAPPKREWDKLIFTNARGIRAGWRLLIFIGIGATLGYGIRLILMQLQGSAAAAKGPFTPERAMLGEGLTLAIALAAAAIMSVIESRKFRIYFAPVTARWWRNFFTGIGWGFLALSLLLLLIRIPGDYSLGMLSSHGGVLARDAILWAIMFILVGCTEEFLMRGYAQFTLATGIGFWPAAILLSLLFGFGHHGNLGEDIVGLMSAGLIGLFFAFTLWRTGSLAFAIGMHFMWDYCESFIFGTPDSGLVSKGVLFRAHFQGSPWISGGSVGPEGSVLIFAVIALLFVAFHFAYPQRRYPDPKTL